MIINEFFFEDYRYKFILFCFIIIDKIVFYLFSSYYDLHSESKIL